jgi:hypothetical protein
LLRFIPAKSHEISREFFPILASLFVEAIASQVPWQTNSLRNVHSMALISLEALATQS